MVSNDTRVLSHYGRHTYRPNIRPEFSREITARLKRHTVKHLTSFLHSEFPHLGNIEVEKQGRSRWVIYTDQPMSSDLVKMIEDQFSDNVSRAPKPKAGAHGLLTTDMRFFEAAHMGGRG